MRIIFARIFLKRFGGQIRHALAVSLWGETDYSMVPPRRITPGPTITFHISLSNLRHVRNTIGRYGEEGLALVILGILFLLHMVLFSKVASALLPFARRRDVTTNCIVAMFVLPAVLIAVPISFPAANVFFPPHHVALLYVVGNKNQPAYVDGDIMVTSPVIEDIAEVAPLPYCT
jgi:hypothetical protein